MKAPGAGSERMLKQLPVMIVACLLGACSSGPAADGEPSQAVPGGCYQSQWQAETVPVINKRLGPDGLEKYDDEHQRKAPGCP